MDAMLTYIHHQTHDAALSYIGEWPKGLDYVELEMMQISYSLPSIKCRRQ
jgi:hypothetical protein